jgi:two-component system, NarL family, response regulator DesR
LSGPIQDVDVLEPEPSVAVVATAPLLRRRILAALDFDRLPVAAHGEEPAAILAEADRHPPSVAVVAGGDCDAVLASLRELRRDLPGARVVVVPERIDCGPLHRALRAGAAAAIPASQVEIGLALAVRAASAGLVVIPEAMRESPDPPMLSPRERAVLALAAEGSTTAEIASGLRVCIATVKRHLSSRIARRGVENRSDARARLVGADRDAAAKGLE